MMKSLILLIAIAATLTAAEPAKKKTTKAPSAPRVVTAPVLTIPKDAVPNADGSGYNYTDKSGKNWVYAKTPFGVTRTPASGITSSNAAAGDATGAKVIDQGDSVRFERAGPFGAIVWEKNKTELTDSERQIVDAQKAPKN